jgi:hypothetical protein
MRAAAMEQRVSMGAACSADPPAQAPPAGTAPAGCSAARSSWASASPGRDSLVEPGLCPTIDQTVAVLVNVATVVGYACVNAARARWRPRC